MNTDLDLRKMRTEYTKEHFNKLEALDNPIEQFEQWFQKARDNGVKEVNAMTLATVGSNRPSLRVVLLKQIFNNKFIFFSNYMGRKGREIKNNPCVSLNFFWTEMEQQIRIEGIARKTSDKISDDYFAMRDRESQIGAWASKQSEDITKEELFSRIQIFKGKFEGRDVPRPPHWGGYEVEPYYIEFWQGGPNRIHDRIVYIKDNQDWKIKRIGP